MYVSGDTQKPIPKNSPDYIQLLVSYENEILRLNVIWISYSRFITDYNNTYKVRLKLKIWLNLYENQTPSA